MTRCFIILLAMIALSHSPRAPAAAPAIAIKEIDYLLGFIDSSGCKFFRNGSWYDAHRAQAHLREKYNFLAAHARIKTAEDFIEQAATRSSMSGVEYQIQCGSDPAVPSNLWLHTALLQYRSTLAAVLRAPAAIGMVTAYRFELEGINGNSTRF